MEFRGYIYLQSLMHESIHLWAKCRNWTPVHEVHMMTL